MKLNLILIFISFLSLFLPYQYSLSIIVHGPSSRRTPPLSTNTTMDTALNNALNNSPRLVYPQDRSSSSIIDHTVIINSTTWYLNKSLIIEASGCLIIEKSIVKISPQVSISIRGGQMIIRDSILIGLYKPIQMSGGKILVSNSHIQYLEVGIDNKAKITVTDSYVSFVNFYLTSPATLNLTITQSDIDEFYASSGIYNGNGTLTIEKSELKEIWIRGSSTFNSAFNVAIINNTVVTQTKNWIYARNLNLIGNIFCSRNPHIIKISGENIVMRNNQFYNIYIKFEDTKQITSTNNIVNARGLLLIINTSHYIVSGEYGEIALISSKSVTIDRVETGYIYSINSESIDILNSNIEGLGIYLRHTNHTKIYNNKIILNGTSWDNSIMIDLSNSVEIINNTIVGGAYSVNVPGYACPNCIMYGIKIINNTIRSAVYGIKIFSARGTIISGNSISHCEYGIIITSDSLVLNNIISNNKYGLVIYGYNNTIFQCQIIYNTFGIYSKDPIQSEIMNCTITSNVYGIYINITNPLLPNENCTLVVKWTNIYSNEKQGLYVTVNASPKVIVDARYCWWGSKNGPETSKTGDPNDPEEIWYEGNCSIMYDPWLTEAALVGHKNSKGNPENLIPILIVTSLLATALAIVYKRNKIRIKRFFKKLFRR